ncbi:hypothetical protein J2W27_000785 [Variovorax boronicumulans]|uniref:hypothetical protein n=1 Tax=Variovorax boronicumulans TaxID=436515 RepID=UPI0027877184|nr:hypothetical protein [Variovorax boronicumulans]MDP9908692.1 hypothetical protein [Variovorax boronicumulans]
MAAFRQTLFAPPSRPSQQQAEARHVDQRMTCTVEEAREMLKVPPVELFDAEPVEA